MFKKSPSRNQRSKGIKVKHVLQVCVLLGVCFWLIYQVKHSHDKRKEFDEKDAKVSVKTQSEDVILKFGRKDLPHVQEVDENEQERAGGEADHEEEFIDEEKEREAEGDDKENEEKENEEKEGQDESDNAENDQNHDGGRNAHEAREEHYKADDASSAVSHDTQSINSETDKLDMENNSTMNASLLQQESRNNTTEETNGDENNSESKVDEGGNSSNFTKENDLETGSSNSGNTSLPNTANTTDFIDQASNNSTEVNKETGSNSERENIEMPGTLQNGTTTVDGMVTEEKYKEQANETISNSIQSDSNTVDSMKLENVDLVTRESSNSSSNAESGISEDITKKNATAGGDSVGYSETKESTDSTQNEKPEGENESGGTDESSDTNVTEDEGPHDPIDSSDNTLPQEEKDARVDLSTLPDIRTEGSHEDAAAE
ncbi:hypothetical protein CCACVL1_16237 [Corchorus capsularis]|uniref:Uncharacterized protein n=1 Tax=Corchorus capsularis TaxID=210143 RepID=A0A1R3HY59_COCAP|nr:hypothetical protein CCACVL1_16237 [Corchorus capsularis]